MEEIYHLLHPWGEVSQGKTKSISTQNFIMFILRFRLFKVIFHFLNKNLVQKMQMAFSEHRFTSLQHRKHLEAEKTEKIADECLTDATPAVGLKLRKDIRIS